MLVLLWVALVLVALATNHLLIGKARRRRHAAGDPLARVFRPDELRELDAHLDEIADAELRLIDADVARYVAGDVGHVVVISNHRHGGIALALSDGHLLTLGVVCGATRKQLLHRASRDKLRPASIEWEGFSYLLLLRGEGGTEMEVHAGRVVLTP
jgi:hypothetical protein